MRSQMVRLRSSFRGFTNDHTIWTTIFAGTLPKRPSVENGTSIRREICLTKHPTFLQEQHSKVHVVGRCCQPRNFHAPRRPKADQGKAPQNPPYCRNDHSRHSLRGCRFMCEVLSIRGK